jgi:hypothetical protein
MDREQVLAAYAAAWAQTDETAIRRALEACWTEVSTYVNPLTDLVTGIAGLTNLILDFPVMFPGVRMQGTGEPDLHHDAACFTWQMCSTAPIRTLGRDFGRCLDGVDFIEFDEEGLIRRITSFFGVAATADRVSANHASERATGGRVPNRRSNGARRAVAESAHVVLDLGDHDDGRDRQISGVG